MIIIWKRKWHKVYFSYIVRVLSNTLYLTLSIFFFHFLFYLCGFLVDFFWSSFSVSVRMVVLCSIVLLWDNEVSCFFYYFSISYVFFSPLRTDFSPYNSFLPLFLSTLSVHYLACGRIIFGDFCVFLILNVLYIYILCVFFVTFQLIFF